MPAVRKKLDVLNKGMIVLLAAVWEGFCEDLTAEAVSLLVDGAPDAAALPTPLRRTVARELKHSPHELAVWRLAGDGWREVLRTRLDYLQEQRNRRLNTPKSANIDEFFKQGLGIDRMSSHWVMTGSSSEENMSKLDSFIELRNAIAHRGLRDAAVSKATVKNFNNHIQRLAAQTESAVEELVERSIGRYPWDMERPVKENA
ncbi:MAG TPA: HEPN domain-containing protein [Solirubrobacterales bacterium]